MKKPSFLLSFMRYLRWGIALLFVAVVVIHLYIYLPVINSPSDSYLPRKGEIKSINITKDWQQNNSHYTELELVSTSGLNVLLQIRRPVNQTRPLPVAVLLGGMGTGRNACSLLPEPRHVVCVSLSYPYYGPQKFTGIDLFYNLSDMQQGVKDTPPVVLLALDYVLSQSYSDKNQVELIGVSFGAYFISIPAVLDERVTRVWIAQGGAQPTEVIRHNFTKGIGSDLLRSLIANLVSYAIGSQHVDPEKWVGKISPRPVIFINAESDEAMPRASVEALHNAAQQPKEIIWTKGMHVTPSRKEVINQLSDIVLKRIVADHRSLPSEASE